MTDAELAGIAEALPLAELQSNIAVLRRRLEVLERIAHRKREEAPRVVFVEFTRVRVLLTK